MKENMQLQISRLREEMINLAKERNNNFLDPEVQKLSQKLDKKIVEYIENNKN